MFESTGIEKNKALYRHYIQVIFNEGQLDSLEALVSPNYVLQDAPPGTPTGPDAIKQVVAMFRTAFADLEITIDDIIGEGDMLAARSTLRGTHTGTIFGIAATGKPVTVKTLTMVRMSHGRVAESWVKNDMLGLMAQLR